MKYLNTNLMNETLLKGARGIRQVNALKLTVLGGSKWKRNRKRKCLG